MLDRAEQIAALTLPAGAIVFLLLTVLEAHYPQQKSVDASFRWLTNFSLYGLVLGVSTFIAPQRLAASVLHGWDGRPLVYVYQHGGALAVLGTGLLLLDVLSYGLHRMQHLALFWRFHAVHHADVALDASTGLRHHPGEYIVNALVGSVILGLFGLPVWIVPVYGFIAMVSDLWTHSNIAMRPRLDGILANVLVTPGLHRIHHSMEPTHFNTNFGAVLSLWDRCFGTRRSGTQCLLSFGVAGVPKQDFLQALLAPYRKSGSMQCIWARGT